LVEFFVFRAMVCVCQILSPRAAARVAESLAFVIHRIVPRKLTRYEVARTNLREALSGELSDHEVDQTIRRMWSHLFRLVMEVIQLSRKLRLDNVVDTIRFRNRPATVRALCSGRPVMLISGHFGNWELAVSVFGLFGFRMGVVTRPLDNPYLHDWFQRVRRNTGHRLIAKKGGFDEMTMLLERRGYLALLADQDAGSNGVFVDFFGRPASTHKAIALMALEYQALICVGYAARLDDEWTAAGLPRFEFGCETVIDPRDCTSADPVRELTELYSAALERVIRRTPHQYFWVHRRWKSRPKARRRATSTAPLRKAS
jgi:KDO2-lipid IV(A) lauroyltransferase